MRSLLNRQMVCVYMCVYVCVWQWLGEVYRQEEQHAQKQRANQRK